MYVRVLVMIGVGISVSVWVSVMVWSCLMLKQGSGFMSVCVG